MEKTGYAKNRLKWRKPTIQNLDKMVQAAYTEPRQEPIIVSKTAIKIFNLNGSAPMHRIKQETDRYVNQLRDESIAGNQCVAAQSLHAQIQRTAQQRRS